MYLKRKSTLSEEVNAQEKKSRKESLTELRRNETAHSRLIRNQNDKEKKIESRKRETEDEKLARNKNDKEKKIETRKRETEDEKLSRGVMKVIQLGIT